MSKEEESALEAVAALMERAEVKVGPGTVIAASVECCGTCDAWYEGCCTVNGPTPIAMQQQRKNLMGQIEANISIQAMAPPMPEHGWCFKWTARREHVRAPQPQQESGGGKPNGSASNR